MKKYPNMEQFAAELNLARSTVSYILNDKWRERNISPETVRRVKDYAQQVNFVPNFFGRAIKGKVRADAAILLPVNAYFHHREAFFRLLSRMEQQTALQSLVLPVSPRADLSPLLEKLIAYAVRKVIVIAAPIIKADNVDSWERLISATPQVDWLLYDCPIGEKFEPLTAFGNVSLVAFDRASSYERICDYVRAAGYRELLYYGFSLGKTSARGLKISQLDPTRGAPISGQPETGAFLGELLLEKYHSHSPKAVFIYDDLLTCGTIEWLLEHGTAVPEEFAFISWDGLDISRFFRKSLTTLVVPHDQMLKFALDFLKSKGAPSRLVLEPVIREGDSMPRIHHKSSR